MDTSSKKVLVCGGGGFIGGHLIRRLRKDGYWVRSIDVKPHDYHPDEADDVLHGDLRSPEIAAQAVKDMHTVFQLACYDRETEVLTDSGWKFFKDLNKTEKFATLNPETNEIEYHTLLNYCEYSYSGTMYNFKGKSIDICVTPNHIMYVKKPHRKDFEFITAEKCNKVLYAVKRTGNWIGEEKKSFTISTDKIYRKEVKKIFTFDMDIFLEFMGWYLSEGSCKNKKNNGTYVIHIANCNEKYLDRIVEVIKAMGFNPHKDRSTSYGIAFCSQIILDYLSQFGLCTEKFIPEEFKILSKRQLKIIFDSLMAGDGNSDGSTYNTTSKQLADDVQEIAFKLGYSTSIGVQKSTNINWNTKYLVYLTKNEHSRILKRPSLIQYDDYVYCVEVPNSVIYVRRNGRAAWCGNCNMGGAGYVFTGDNDAAILHDSALINLNILEQGRLAGVQSFFQSSSACIYKEDPLNSACPEDSAYPAFPDSDYGWEKLFSERLYLAYQRNYNLDVHIARFHNIFGSLGTWNGGKEKAPAALCRKIAFAKLSGFPSIDIWGDGEQTRSFLYVDECIEGVMRSMASPFSGPLNIGSDELVSINTLASMIMEIAGVTLSLKYIIGPQGVRGRNSDNHLIEQTLHWKPSAHLYDGLVPTYLWVETQVKEHLLSNDDQAEN